MNKLKKPKLAKLSLRKTRSTEQKVSEALSNVPRITNETVAGHREDVLSGARKYIYPLQHSKHRLVRISLALLILVVVGFFTISALSLYKFQSTSSFIYDVTRIVPFPVAKVGPDWVSYESYLFELRRNMHYYRTQQQANFNSKDGKNHLDRLQSQAMDQVIQDAYVKQLADKHKVSVSDEMVNNQLALVRSENRLGNSDRVFKEVLREFWGWNEASFKRELKQQMLQQAVVAKLDTGTNKRAEATLLKLKGGADFAKLATEISDDQSTKASGGQYPNAISISDREIPPTLTAELFKLKAGQTSAIVNAGYTLEIVKVNEKQAGNVRASHIQFNLKNIASYTKPLKANHPPSKYIKT